MATEFSDPVLGPEQAFRRACTAGVPEGAAGSVDGVALGVLWDSVEGYGADRVHTGELVLDDRGRVSVAGYIRPFRIPNPDLGHPGPRHAALGLLVEAGLEDDPGTDNVTAAFSADEYRKLHQSLRGPSTLPPTTSLSWLLEGLTAVLGLPDWRGEGLTAADVMAQTAHRGEDGAYLTHPTQAPDRAWVLDWEPLVRAALSDLVLGVPVERIVARIDNGLVEGMTRITGVMNVTTVVLAGNCFHSRHLRARAIRALREQGHRVLLGDGVEAYTSPELQKQQAL